MTITETNKDRFFGLSHTESTVSYTDIDFAVRPYSNGVIYCYEPGVNGAFGGYYSAGDKLRVAVESGVVKYYLISGTTTTLIYTATHSPTYPLSADAAIYDNGGTVTNAVISGNLSSSGGVRVQWVVTDQLGTPRMVFDQSGSLANVKRHDYLPFGEELFAPVAGRSVGQGYAGGDGVRQQFTLKERDIETGLDYFLARYYSSTQGRFTSPDEFKGGPEELFGDVDPHDPLFYADIAEPQSLNKYHYALNNPLRYIDPDGHQTTTADSIKQGAADFITGVGRGISSSITFGASGAPRADDSLLIRAGQGVGTIITQLGGRAAVVGGGASELLTAGASTEVSVPAIVVGVEAVVGSAVNAVRIATTPMQRNSTSSSSDVQPKPVEGSSGGPGAGKRPSESTKEAVRARDNNRCVYCGTKTTRTGSSTIKHRPF